MSRVAITGMGLVDTLGNNPDLCFANYMMKNHYPTEYKYQDSIISHLKCFYSDYELLIPENIKSSIYASLHKINKLGLHSVEQSLIDIPKSSKVAVVYSTTTASGETNQPFHEFCSHGGKRLRPRQLIQGHKDFLVGLIPQIYDFHGINTSMYAACSTSLYNLDYAIRILDDYDYVVVGGSDVGTELSELAWFNELGAVGSHSAPYDRDRDGFIMGEGAGCLILEKEEDAVKRNATVHGYIHSIGMGNDGSSGSATAPDMNCSGIKKAMRDTNFDYNQIAFVNSHGTSTPIGDELEYNAIQEVIGDVPVVSFKSKIGHTMGASGVVELIYTLKALKNNIIPHNHNIINAVCDVPTEVCVTDKKFALKNSLGFGGKNVSVLVEGI
jgi:3-oxoacyl-(acyl-carrier-protein) synthase